MSANPVNAWDMLVQAISESTFGTTPTPANDAAYIAYAVESINCSLGGAETGVIRAKQDRGEGRAETNGWVEGRVMPIDWSFDSSMKSRAAVDTVPQLVAFFKAAGLTCTANGGVSYTLAPSRLPIESGDYASMTLRRFLGQGLACYEAETLRGCVARNLRFEGGGSELLAKFSGVGAGKTTATSQAGVQGRLDSVSFALAGTTSLTITAEESYRVGLGYYKVENEIIRVTACTPGGTSVTVARGELGSTAASHTSVPMVPYRPAPTFTGSPISESTSTFTLDSVAVRCRSFSIDYATGMDLLEPETGARYSQGAKYGRNSTKVQAQLVLSADQVSLLGKSTARREAAVSIVQGTGTGSIFTFAATYCEVVSFTVPDTAGDIAVVDVELRIREAAAGTAPWTVTLT